MKHCICQPDLFRLIHKKDMWISILAVIAVVVGSNITEMIVYKEFLTVDTIMDDFLYSGWFRNILFVVAAIPFSRSYCQDVSHGFRDAMVLKMGSERYAWSKVKYNAYSAFAVTLTGLLISAYFFSLFFEPCYYEVFGEMNYTYFYGTLAAEGKTLLFVLTRSVLFSCGAALFSTFALLVSVWNPEPLVILAVPFIVSYVEGRFMFFVPSWMRIDNCVSGDVLISGGIAANFLYAICFMLLLIMVAGSIFVYQVKRSVNGENTF